MAVPSWQGRGGGQWQAAPGLAAATAEAGQSSGPRALADRKRPEPGRSARGRQPDQTIPEAHQIGDL